MRNTLSFNLLQGHKKRVRTAAVRCSSPKLTRGGQPDPVYLALRLDHAWRACDTRKKPRERASIRRVPRVAHVRFLVVTRAHVSDHSSHASRLTSDYAIYGVSLLKSGRIVILEAGIADSVLPARQIPAPTSDFSNRCLAIMYRESGSGRGDRWRSPEMELPMR